MPISISPSYPHLFISWYISEVQKKIDILGQFDSLPTISDTYTYAIMSINKDYKKHDKEIGAQIKKTKS
jgi:hypothetical protein